MHSKVLVTGGAGYIGSHAVDQLISLGAKVWVLDNFSTGHRILVHPKAQLIEGDTRDIELVHRLLKENEIEAIVHFAAFTSVAESLAHPTKYYENNFQGTISLLKACEKTNVKAFVFSSTAAVYADPGTEPVTENSRTEPVTPYGQSKLMSERAIADSARSLGLKYCILRYFNVAGASLSNQWGQFGDEHTALIKRAALAAVGKVRSLSIFGTDYATVDGTCLRDFIHVEDLAELHIEAMKFLKAGGESQIVNCGYGHGFSVLQVISTMKKVSGIDFPVHIESRRPGDLPQVIANNQKVRTLFGWTPKRDNLELICRTAYQWETKCK